MSNNKNISTFLIGFLVILLAVAAYGLKHYASANDKIFLTAGGKEKIEHIVREYIVNNPEIIIESFKKLEVKKHGEYDTHSLENIKAHKAKLENNSDDPSYGDKNAKITIVHFFDYNCGYCKTANVALEKLLNNEPDIRIVYKEFPILGERSDLSAKIALAVNKLDSSKYHQFHNMLMNEAKIDEEKIKAFIANLGLSYDDVRTLAEGSHINDILTSTKTLAREAQITGTPTLVINGNVIPGGVNLESLQEVVTRVKKESNS